MNSIKALFLAANPKGSTKLDLDEEIREITIKVRQSDDRDLLNIVSFWALRPDDLLQYLNQHKPQIVHFSGHGSSKGELILLDEAGNPKGVSSAALKALFRTLKDNIKIVVLNACYSEIQGEAIAEEIDYVVGMNMEIGDKAAIKFSASFYRALCFNRTIQEAFDQATTSLMLEGIPEENTPVLIIKKQGVTPNKTISKSTQLSDSLLIKEYKKIFDRPAFRTPCIWELFIREVSEAIDDIQAAFNTGKLYSRNGNLLADLTVISEIDNVRNKTLFEIIRKDLTQLKRALTDFESNFRNIHPGYSHHENFYAMVMSLPRVASGRDIRELVYKMDEIDMIRNRILSNFNELLDFANESNFELIELSSKILKVGHIGGSEYIKEYL